MRVLIRFVPQAASDEEDEQQRTGTEDHDIIRLPAPVDKGARPSCDDKMRGDE